MSFAKVVLSGTLVGDPEKRFTPNNHAVTNFTIEVENGGGKGTNEPFMVRVACWRNLADAAVERLQKGDNVLVEGKLIMNSYQSQEGVQKKGFEIEASAIDKLSGRPESIAPAGGYGGGDNQSFSGGSANGGASRAEAPAYAASYNSAPSQSAGHFSSEDLLTEDDIPF